MADLDRGATSVDLLSDLTYLSRARDTEKELYIEKLFEKLPQIEQPEPQEQTPSQSPASSLKQTPAITKQGQRQLKMLAQIISYLDAPDKKLTALNRLVDQLSDEAFSHAEYWLWKATATLPEIPEDLLKRFEGSESYRDAVQASRAIIQPPTGPSAVSPR